MDKPLKRIINTVKEAVRIDTQNGNVYQVLFSWRGKTLLMKLFFPEIKQPTRQEVQGALDKVYPSAQVRSYYRSNINYSDTYINVGKGDGIK